MPPFRPAADRIEPLEQRWVPPAALVALTRERDRPYELVGFAPEELEQGWTPMRAVLDRLPELRILVLELHYSGPCAPTSSHELHTKEARTSGGSVDERGTARLCERDKRDERRGVRRLREPRG